MRLLALMALALLLSGCMRTPDAPAGSDLGPRFDAALAYVEGLRDAEGRWPTGQVPYVLDIAVAAHLDPGAWPAARPIAEQTAWPDEGLGFLASLRALDAEAQSAAAANDEARLERVRERVLAGFDGHQFGDPALLNDDAFALLALGHARVAWSSQLEPAIAGLLENQTGGGWSWAAGGTPETDVTGMVLAGLAEAGAIHRVDAPAALAFLASTRTDEGGHGLAAGGEANCDSTAWAIRAQDQLGREADAEAWAFLLGLQGADGGFAYTPGGPANVLCTLEATTLLAMAASSEVTVPDSLRR